VIKQESGARVGASAHREQGGTRRQRSGHPPGHNFGGTGVDRGRIRELEQFGILCSHGLNGDQYYDGDDFVVLSIARDFFKYGIEPRHLMMYRHFAEREATFFESIVLPMLRQKNPDARRAAAANLADLAQLSRKLKQALLRTNLRQYLQTS